MESFVYYLGCGRLSASKNAAYYTCSKFSDTFEKKCENFLVNMLF